MFSIPENTTHKQESDFLSELENQMASNGLSPDQQIIADDKIHRYSSTDKKNNKAEWYFAHEGLSSKKNKYLICIYGSWRTSEKHKFKSWENGNNKFDMAEKKELTEIYKKKHLEAEQKLKEQHDKTALEAKKIYDNAPAEPLTEEYTKYLTNKDIKATPEIRYEHNEYGYPSIIIPLRNIDGEIRTLQFISVSVDGKVYKSFLTGGEKKGSFFVLGELSDGTRVYIVEGFATGVSVYAAIKSPVVVAIDKGNLDPVIENLRNKYPNSNLIIAGDNDINEEDINYGRDAAMAAAKKHGCFVTIPEAIDGKSTDFNDVHKNLSLEEVKKQLKNIIKVQTQEDELSELAAKLSKKNNPSESFQLSLLPPILRNYVSEICETTNAHPLMITCAVLTTISVFMKKRFFINYYQVLYPNLWLLCIAGSGQFKTTALSRGLKFANEKNSKINNEIKELKKDLKVAQEEKEKTKIEEQIEQLTKENVLLPLKNTSEGLLELLDQGREGGIIASEFSDWLRGLEKSHNGDMKPMFVSLYDCVLTYEYHTKGGGTYIADKSFISIMGVTTLSWLKKDLKKDDSSSGFLARFLMFTIPDQDIIPSFFPTQLKAEKTNAEMAFEEKLKKIEQTISCEYTYSEKAIKTGDYFHQEIYKMKKNYNEKCKEVLGCFEKRWSPYLVKLSMPIQFFFDDETTEIGEESVISAFNILLPAIKSTAELFEKELGESEHQQKERKVYRWICEKVAENGRPVTRAEIQASRQLSGGPKELDDVLEGLLLSEEIGTEEVYGKKEKILKSKTKFFPLKK
jgi:phage/plasmid primase-like uncharacterized protein